MDLGPLDPGYVANVLSRPPFVQIDGVHNVRDLGSYPSSRGKVIKPNLVFRSAEIAAITKKGKAQMRDLGITRVFDLRSDTEIEKYGTPLPVIEGVEVLRTPIFRKDDYSPVMMAKRFQLYASGKTEAFMELYSQILDSAGSALDAICRHIRDSPTEGILIHCTAGKDRTGVVAAIILKLAGVSDEEIANDYALTRIGREPLRERSLIRLSMEPLFASNHEAALNMFTCRTETMLEFLKMLQNQYGGVEEYIKQYTGISDDDIVIIRDNLLYLPTSASRQTVHHQ